MEEEVTYASVVFRNGSQPPNENKEAPKTSSTAQGKQSATTAPADGQSAARSEQLCWLLVFLGTLLLVVSISVILYISLKMKGQELNFSEELLNLTTKNLQLTMERSLLENKTKELSRDRDDLHAAFRFILKFKSFPASNFCPEKKCQPCMIGWIRFGENCYFFDDSWPPWKTWAQSQNWCQTKSANLVIIDSHQEQEFINGHIKTYYSENHGYWCGLRKNEDKDWVWLDGHNDTLGNWQPDKIDKDHPCALIIPQEDSKQNNWAPVECIMENKFICENEAWIGAPAF